LRKDITKERVILVFINVVNPDMSLEVVRPGIPVVSIRAKRTDVARGFMDKAMPDHLVFALKTFATLAAGTSFDRAIVRSGRRVYICVRVEQVLRLKRLRGATGDLAHIASDRLDGHAVYAHAVEARSCWWRPRLMRACCFWRIAGIIAGSM